MKKLLITLRYIIKTSTDAYFIDMASDLLKELKTYDEHERELVDNKFNNMSREQISMWLWVWLGIIVFIKLANIMSGFMLQKTFVAKHTAANKITGILLFLFPFSLPLLPLEYSATAVCSMATIAAIHEGIYMKTDKQ